MAYKIKSRCIRCLTILRESGTCPNEDWPEYVPDKVEGEPVEPGK